MVATLLIWLYSSPTMCGTDVYYTPALHLSGTFHYIFSPNVIKMYPNFPFVMLVNLGNSLGYHFLHLIFSCHITI
jgi:hypothetical protein